MDWAIDPECLTAGGTPRQYWTKDGEVFVLTATRTTGPDDTGVPRRVLATGRLRAQVRVSLRQTISAYDPSSRLLLPH